jgi:hypothetical protein
MFETKPKLLIGIICCHHRAWATNTIRNTWVKDINGRCDYKFFYGAGTHDPILEDEVILGGDDAYKGLACKVQNAVKWALDNGYDAFFKVDDDTYTRAERLLRAGFEKYEYVGRKNGWTDKYHECVYARGGTGYYLSKRAMEYLAKQETPNPDHPKDYAEDSFVGRHMETAKIECTNDNRLRCADFSGPNRGPRPTNSTTWKKDIPLMSNDFITTCEFLGPEMVEVHNEWIKSREAYDKLLGKIRLK